METGGSVGPILATGAITMARDVLARDRPVDFRVPVATAIAAVGFSLLEKPFPKAAVALAWLALMTTVLVRPKGGKSVAEEIIEWYEKGE